MSNQKYVSEYRKNTVNGASPIRLVIMLYDGAIRFLDLGREAMGQKDYDNQNSHLQRAQKIILELMSCLDMERGGEIAENLFKLYAYMIQELVEANIKDQSEPIDRSRKILCELRESWIGVEEKLKSPAAPDQEVQIAA